MDEHKLLIYVANLCKMMRVFFPLDYTHSMIGRISKCAYAYLVIEAIVTLVDRVSISVT